MERTLKILAVGGLCVFFTLFLLMPVYTVLEQGLRLDLICEIFSSQIYVEGLWNSFCIAVVTTLLVFMISLPLALIFDKFDFAGKNLCNLAVMIPMILPPFVGALGFQQILGHYGVVNTILTELGFGRVDFLGGDGRFWSVCVIEALHLYPILYLNLITALGNIDPAMDEAGSNLGGGRFYRLWRITLPLMKPGIFAGGSLVMIWSFTELGTPLMFGYTRTAPVQIFNGITELETNPLPYSLVIVVMFFSILLYASGRFAFSGGQGASMTVKGAGSSSAVTAEGKWKWLAPGVFVALTLLAALPHIALILTAFTRNWYGTILPEHLTMINFDNALSHKLVIPSITNSLKYSCLAMVFALAAGVLTSLAVVRWRIKGATVLDMMAMLPLAVPGIVIAFGYLGMSVKYGWAREYFNPMQDPLFLLAAAYAIRRLPYVVRSVSSGLEQTSEELENAARNLGAGPFRTLAKVTLPLLAANMIVGALFAFSFSMLEVSDSLILAQKGEYFPITRAIFELSQILGSGPYTACAFGVWTMLFMAGTLAAAGILLGRKLGAVFKL